MLINISVKLIWLIYYWFTIIYIYIYHFFILLIHYYLLLYARAHIYIFITFLLNYALTASRWFSMILDNSKNFINRDSMILDNSKNFINRDSKFTNCVIPYHYISPFSVCYLLKPPSPFYRSLPNKPFFILHSRCLIYPIIV